MFAYANCIAIGVNGFTISAYSGRNPPVFCKFINPFWIILSISYFAIMHKSSVPVIVKTFLFFLEVSSLFRQTNAPVLAFIPLIVSPPFPITKPMSLTGTYTSIL